MWKKWLVLIVLLLFRNLSALANKDQIIKLYFSINSAGYHLLLDSSSAIHFHYFKLTKPERLVIEIQKAHLIHSLIKNFPGTLIRTVRTSYYKSHKLRIVFDLKHSVKIHLSSLKTNFKNPHFRFLINLTNSLYKFPPQIKHTTTFPIQSSLHTRVRNIIIVIDPGHGGHDPGAIGSGGAHEKNIVLKISRYLQKYINQQQGFRAYLTRNGDRYLTLRQRLAIARGYQADMFIAVHADTCKNCASQGASVFALSQRGATSEAARWIATKENESELIGGIELANKNNLLKSVLINLSQTATIQDSLYIGQKIILALRDISRLHHRFVEQAAFVVLKSPDIPSLLIETGFISNAYEERKLLNPTYQQHIALALMQGIRNYFLYSPPPGTWLAEKVK